jgi:6-phosphogluconolactonase
MAVLQVEPDTASLTRAAADFIAGIARDAIATNGRFTIALSGGDTPRPVYTLLASDEFSGQIEWPRVHVFWGDERCVPPNDAESNYRMAKEALLDRVPLLPANIHRMHGEDDPKQAAAAYGRTLCTFFGGDPAGGPPPAGFDLVVLGMGDNGHTASLFPGEAAAREQQRWVMAENVEALSEWRITLTPVIINAAANVAFLVSGHAKAARLQQVLESRPQPDVLPAQAIRPTSGRLTWLLDAAAASNLTRAP